MAHQRNFFSIIAFCILQLSCFAQKDTIFINRIGTIVPKDSAKYFRFMSKIDSELYKIEDHFMTGQIQMTGYCTSTNAAIKTNNYIFYDSLGAIASEGEYVKGFKSGMWRYYYKYASHLKSVKEYNYPQKGYYLKLYDSLTYKIMDEGFCDENDKAKGIWKTYFYNSDSILYKRNFSGGRKEGTQYEYYKNGAVKRIEVFENFKLTDGKQFNEDGKKIKYFPAFEYPEPPESIYYYLLKRVKCFDETVKSTKFQYKLVVHSDGSVSNIEIFNVPDEACKKEIIEKMIKMGKWKPAKRENVPYNYTIELGFR